MRSFPSTPLFAMLAFTPSLVACAITAPAPAGPLHPGTTSQVETSWAASYGPASATIGGTRIHGNGQTFSGSPGPDSVLPLRIGLRQTIAGVVDAAADVGWLDAGGELRAGINRDARMPFSVMVGYRTGMPIFEDAQRAHEERLRLEFDPDISRARDGSARLILGVGVSAGDFLHDIIQPVSLRQQGGDSPDFSPSGAIFIRPERRLELAMGVELRHNAGAVSFVLAPWILLASDPVIEATCHDCGDPFPTDYAQSWGINFIVTPKVFGDPLGSLFGGRAPRAAAARD